MFQVARWIEEFALASYGFDANLIEEASHTSDASLEELFRGQELLIPLDEAMVQTLALREVGRMGRRMHPSDFVETLTTAQFTHYFADAISRAFYDDYVYDVGAWEDYTYPDTTPDFRDVARFRMSEPGTLTKRREKQSHKATYISETEINYGVEEYSEEFDVSWRAIVNDDLGKIRETPTRMANAAKRWKDAWVSALYDNATTQAALVALGAVYSGTGRLTHPNLAIGLNAMMQRVDAQGNQMNVGRVWLVIPKVLEIQARTILQSTQAAGTPNNDTNVLPQFIAGYRIDPYIGFAGISVPWYLVADPSEIPTITVATLEGWSGPVTFMKESNIRMLSGVAPAAFTMGSFETGDIEFGVEDIIGGWDDASYVGVTDFRGIYYSSGTTP